MRVQADVNPQKFWADVTSFETASRDKQIQQTKDFHQKLQDTSLLLHKNKPNAMDCHFISGVWLPLVSGQFDLMDCLSLEQDSINRELPILTFLELTVQNQNFYVPFIKEKSSLLVGYIRHR